MTIPLAAENPDLDVDAVGKLLQSTFNAVVGVFDQAGVDLPDRRYIHYGPVAADCEQFTVELAQVFAGLPGENPNEVQKCNGPRSAFIVIAIFRTVPVASGPRGQLPPTPDAMSASTLGFARDAWLLMDAIHEVDSRGWKRGAIAQVSPIGPSGGFAGTQATLTIQIP